ncbi:unnamed protein product [Caenorhabditis nigoni]
MEPEPEHEVERRERGILMFSIRNLYWDISRRRKRIRLNAQKLRVPNPFPTGIYRIPEAQLDGASMEQLLEIKKDLEKFQSEIIEKQPEYQTEPPERFVNPSGLQWEIQEFKRRTMARIGRWFGR